MKERLEIKKMGSILSVLWLACMLLLSPCKVRNYIQDELGIPQTKVSNKSLSTFSQTNCQNFEIAEAVQAKAKPTLQPSQLLLPETCRLSFTYDVCGESTHHISLRNHSVSPVPLYILYQNIKVYS